jgi:hypothetical protein
MATPSQHCKGFVLADKRQYSSSRKAWRNPARLPIPVESLLQGAANAGWRNLMETFRSHSGPRQHRSAMHQPAVPQITNAECE